MKSIISSTVTRKMTIGIAILLVGITAFGITVFGMVDKTFAAESTLSLSIDNSTVKVNVAPTSTNGTFRKGTASTISASTNNATGYTLSISAPSASGSDYDKLINTADNTAKISSISSPTTEEQYKALNNTSYNNTWGYLPSKYCSDGTSSTCTANTDFLPAPTIAGDVLDQTTAANTAANTYTIGMGTRIDSTTKTGKYQGSFIVKLVANAIPYSIVYDDNVVSNMPTDVSTTTPDTSVTIDSKVPVRAGYKFLGWCAGTVTTTNNTDSCSGTVYNPNGGGTNLTYTLDQTGGSNALSLVAMWKEVTYLQNLSADKCTTTMSTAIDSRDGTEYHIQRLADGNCWLLDNLALDLTNSTVLSGMTADNTNASNTTLGYLKGTTTGTTSDQYATAAVANWTSSYSYSAPLVNISNKDVVPTAYNGTDDPMKDQVVAGNWKVGGYYNYCAASAGSYCYGDGTSYGTSSGNATEDICPKGWRMPGGGSTVNLTATPPTGEYQNLYNNSNYNTYANYRSALRLPLSGYFNNGSARFQGSYGGFWSSTRDYDDTMYYLYVGTSGIYPANYDGRSYGYSVRCVLGT